jgi:cell division transport system permease protein
VRYTFTELGQGLRRNLSMHLAVVLTLFVSLTLVGMGVLLNQQASKATDYWGSELQITAWLCKARDENAACVSEVTDAQKQAISKVVEDNPEVSDFHFETKEEAFEKLQEVYKPGAFEGANAVITADDMPQSLWIELKDPEEFEGITSAIKGLDGVSSIRDERDTLAPIYNTLDALQWGALGTALFLVVAALLLVANTIRLAAFARRRFLLEAVVTAVLGVLLATGALAAFEKFGIKDRIEGRLNFIPWIDWPEIQVAVVAIAVLGPLLTLVPTLVLTRKYLKV